MSCLVSSLYLCLFPKYVLEMEDHQSSDEQTASTTKEEWGRTSEIYLCLIILNEWLTWKQRTQVWYEKTKQTASPGCHLCWQTKSNKQGNRCGEMWRGNLLQAPPTSFPMCASPARAQTRNQPPDEAPFARQSAMASEPATCSNAWSPSETHLPEA